MMLMALALFHEEHAKPSCHWCGIGKRNCLEFSKKGKNIPLVNASFAKQSIISSSRPAWLIIRKGNWRYLARVRKKQEEILDEEMPEASFAVGPIGVLASVLIALMSSAILHNLIWRQSLAVEDGTAEDRPYIEITASETKKKPREPSTRVSVVKKNSDRSALIAAVQQELSAQGLFAGDADGLSGEKTRAAIKAYQRRNGLAETGSADRQLLDRLRYTGKLLSASEYTSTIAPSGDERVIRIQRGLAALGYRPGAFDGHLGAQTREAVRQFERDRNWPVTGEISELLIDELSDIGAFAEAP
jgi:peptidoglycan hydrolase-like protein with peptidoglycan-binding domain